MSISIFLISSIASFIDVIMFNSVDTHIYLNFHELRNQHSEGWFYFDIFTLIWVDKYGLSKKSANYITNTPP